MYKKFIIVILMLFTLSHINVAVQAKDAKPLIQPLKIEQNHKKYKYGTLEKTFKNPANKNIQNDDFATEGRRILTVLDVLNIVFLVFSIIIIILVIYLKMNNTTLRALLTPKRNNNRFKILSAKQLDNGQTIYLVEVNSRQVIVGTTNSKIDSIAPLDKSYTQDEIPQEYIENLFSDKAEEFKDLEE